LIIERVLGFGFDTSAEITGPAKVSLILIMVVNQMILNGNIANHDYLPNIRIDLY